MELTTITRTWNGILVEWDEKRVSRNNLISMLKSAASQASEPTLHFLLKDDRLWYANIDIFYYKGESSMFDFVSYMAKREVRGILLDNISAAEAVVDSINKAYMWEQLAK